MRHERPLSDAERERLVQIRRNAAIRNGRNRIGWENEKDFWWKVAGVIIILLILFWPLIVWHRPGSATPTSVGWVMEVFWIGAQVGIVAVAVAAQRGRERARDSKRPRQER